MMRLTKRALSAFLVFVMVFTMLPLQSWAEGVSITENGGSANMGPFVSTQDSGDATDYTVPVDKEIEITADKKGYWSSNNPDVAKITGNKWNTSKVTVEGVSCGTTTITCRYWNGEEKQFTVQVIANVTDITLPETLTLKGKDTQKLTATVMPENAEGYTISWNSSNKEVATVDQEGNVTSVGVGEARITATVTGTSLTGTCQVTVSDVKATGITLQPMNLAIGKSGKMTVTYEPGEPFDAALTWTSSAPEIATVDEDGTIHALKEGQTTITAALNGTELTSAAQLTVTQQQPESITLNKEMLTLQGLTSEQLKATVLPENAVDKTVIWTSSNPDAATVDQNGLVTAVAPGQTTIVARTSNGLEASCEVTVERLDDGSNVTVVYVYLKIDNQSGVPVEGWTENQNGWYTIGKIYVPKSVLNRAGSGAYNPGASVVTPYLPYIELSNINAAVAAGVTLQDCSWNLKLVSDGADDYVTSGYTWHLDGTYTILPAVSTLTVRYKDTFGNMLDEPKVVENISNGTAVPVQIPAFANYTVKTFNGMPVEPGTDSKNVLIVKDTVVDIIYQANAQTYTVKYLDKDTQEEIYPSRTEGSVYGTVIQAADIARPTIENYTFDRIEPIQSLTIGNNNGTNVFNLYYARNTFDVIYQYVDPVTGKQVTQTQKEQKAGETLDVMQAPSIPGYTFNGWTTDDVAVNEGKFVMPNKDVTFTGSWTINNYNVTYQNSADGPEVDLPENLSGKHIGETIDAPTLTAEGYIFRGWTSTPSVSISDGKFSMPASDVVLTATWTAIDYTVTYVHVDAPQGLAVPTDHESYHVGEKVPVQDNIATWTGHTFEGWYLNGQKVDKEFTMPAGSVTLEGHWTTDKYDIIYKYDETAPSNAPEIPDAYQETDVEYGTKKSRQDDLTLEGYTFNGWTTDDVTVGEDGMFEMPDGDVTFIGSWTINSHSIKYEYKDKVPAGAPTVPTEESGVSYNTKKSVAANPTLPGYTFSGWRTDDVTVGEDGMFEMPDSDVVFTGSWTIRTDLSYTINYYWNGTTEAVPGLDSQKVGNQTFNSTVILDNSKLPTADGYTLVPGTYSVTIGADENSNVVNVYYYKDVTLTANSDEKVYNGAPQTVEPGYTCSEAGAAFEGIIPSGSGKNVGPYAITFPADTVGKVDTSGKYIVETTHNGTLTIKPKAVTITADNKNKEYGQVNPPLTASVSGVIEGENAEKLITYTLSTTAEQYSPVKEGGYPITVTGDLVQGNYSVTYQNGTLMITKARSMTVEGTNYDEAYDGQTHGTAAVPSVAEGTTLSYSTDEGRTWKSQYPTIKDVGEIHVLVKATNANYEDATNEYVLKVTPKPVTITVADSSKMFGAADPAFTGEVTGLVAEGDLGAIEYVRTNDAENVGVYPDVLDVVYTRNSNYEVTVKKGDFEIIPSTALTITATGGEKVYDGTALYGKVTVKIGNTVTDAATVEYQVGQGEWTTKAPGIVDAGTMTVKVRATLANYKTAEATYTLKVTPKPVTITVANSSKEFGTADPAFTGNVTGLVAGNDLGAIKYVRTNDAEEVGVYPDVLDAVYTPNSNYKVTVNKGDFEITESEPEVDPTDYTLTPIVEEETPLANMDLGEHTCCVLHFLLMLAAMIVLGFYTKSRKKHQERIFELKRTLAKEKGLPEQDDPEHP